MGDSLRWVVDTGGVTVGDRVVIQGGGPQGIGAVIAAREAGASQVIATGLAADADRLAVAKMLGADATLEIEATPVVEGVRELTGDREVPVVSDRLAWKEIRWQGSSRARVATRSAPCLSWRPAATQSSGS